MPTDKHMVTIPINEYDVLKRRCARASELAERTRILIKTLQESQFSNSADVLDAADMASTALNVFVMERINNY